MSKRQRFAFSPEFKLEPAQLVVDKGCTTKEAGEAMNIGSSSLERRVFQLSQERQEIIPQGNALSEDQKKIKTLE